MINDSGTETIICLDTNFCYVKEIFAKTCLKRVLVTNLVDLLPFWKIAVGTLFDKIPHGKVERDANIHSFKNLLKLPPERLDIQVDPMKDLGLHPLYRRNDGLSQGGAWKSPRDDLLCQGYYGRGGGRSH